MTKAEFDEKIIGLKELKGRIESRLREVYKNEPVKVQQLSVTVGVYPSKIVDTIALCALGQESKEKVDLGCGKMKGSYMYQYELVNFEIQMILDEQMPKHFGVFLKKAITAIGEDFEILYSVGIVGISD